MCIYIYSVYTHVYAHTFVRTVHACIRTYARTFVRTDVRTYVRTYLRAYPGRASKTSSLNFRSPRLNIHFHQQVHKVVGTEILGVRSK